MDDKEFIILLFSAVQHRNDSLLEDLLADSNRSQFLDTPGDDGNSLLHVAVMENNQACVDILLKHGADPNLFDANRARTPLHLAVELGLNDIVRAFLELEHVNLELRDDRNLTCYEIAQYCDNSSLAELIRDRQEEIEQLRNDFYAVMNQACTKNDVNLVRSILERFEKRIIDRLPERWQLHSSGQSFARSSLKQMINWSSSSWNDVTLLFKSASKGHTGICKLLIDYGATAKCNENTNYSPLYVAAYGGYAETVKLILDSFPSLIREVTIEKWTVLHACCLQGHSATAKLILDYPYPESLKRRYVSQSGLYEYQFAFDLNAQDAAGQTVTYLAVSANNESLLDTLLNFKIEADLLQSANSQHRNQSSSRIDINQTPDSSGAGKPRIVADRPKPRQDNELVFRNRPSNQLDKILRQLQRFRAKEPWARTELNANDLNDSSSREDSQDPVETKCMRANDEDRYLICPFEMDIYCDYNSKTALHLAVCQQYHNLATILLVNGASPNLPILFRDSMSKSGDPGISFNVSESGGDVGLGWLRSSKSTCLKEACRLNDETMCEILIRYGARDSPDNLALQVAALNKNNNLISMFLSLKSNVDSEYKINRKCNVEFASRYKQDHKASRRSSATNAAATTFSSMFPSKPVTIDWQNIKCIKQIDPRWLIDASLQHNKRLRHPTNGLMAITRLDLSCNNLRTAHPVIFRLPSLRELNLSKNRLESLVDFGKSSGSSFSRQQNSSKDGESITSKLIESHRIAMKRSKSSNFMGVNLENSNSIDLNEPQEWDLPFLEVLDLHDNLLIALPDCLFQLPKLTELDVSSNQLRQLPWSMWTAPALKELIASGNLLDDLPKSQPLSYHGVSISHSPLEAISDVTSEDKPSLNSNQSMDKLDCSFANSSIESEATSKCFGDMTLFTSNIKLDSVKLVRLNHWSTRVDLIDCHPRAFQEATSSPAPGDSSESGAQRSRLTYLNLSHNSFASVSPVLACLATDLNRLNLSHNCLRSLGDISLLPSSLKNLDLSNNQIADWFQFSLLDDDTKHCYGENLNRQCSTRYQRGHLGLSPYCVHKVHHRLDHLKSLNLSRNALIDIQLFNHQQTQFKQNESGSSSMNTTRDSYASPCGTMSPMLQNFRLDAFFPNITALDLSFNHITKVPESLSRLKDLSVLNLSGNVQITKLPPELGLATKLWNLSVNGCNLSEPLKSIVDSKTYKTMDIIGYLRSILEEARPYARMKLMLVGLQGIGKTSLLEQMRQEGSSGVNSRRRTPEHWTRRMGHTSKSSLRNQRGVTLSTVGVDIHDWIYQKKFPRNQPNLGPVSFSTWDFGGQDEFYATHRYFLSKRSIYLVVWRLTDGLQGILGIQQWLVNIQSRAPGSPVIIVGTHEDLVEGGEKGARIRELQAEVYQRFINVSDHDKCGLPRVADSLVVSTKNKLNIRGLCDRIYDVVFSLRCPGSTERLLEQRIPATYLYLEEIVASIVRDRQQKKREPVLTYEEYRRITSEQLRERYNKRFRDLEPLNSREVNYNSELQQATRFLHENGVLLHYEDTNLRDLYFLDPQWLCDILSHVVTIREINPHVKNGLMKIEDLNHLFKSMDVIVSGGAQSYVVNLLNKFEVALTWNSQYLLIPSLLPKDLEALTTITSPMQNVEDQFQLKIPPRMRGRSAVRRSIDTNQANRMALSNNIRATSIDPSRRRGSRHEQALNAQAFKYFYEFESDPQLAISRLVLLRYLPAGFLARLQSGLLSEPAFDEICEDLQFDLLNKLFNVHGDKESLEEFSSILGSRPAWLLWKSGIRLNLQRESTINNSTKNNRDGPSDFSPPCLLSLEEHSAAREDSSLDRLSLQVECLEIDSCNVATGKGQQRARNDRLISQGLEVISSKWIKFDQSQYSNVLVIVLPNYRLRVTNKEDRSINFTIGFSHQNISKILAKVVDHIDNLLEDWYPSLGARFAHTLGGSYLVTRVVPCQSCFLELPTKVLHDCKRDRGDRSSAIQQRSSRLSSRSKVADVKFTINAAADSSQQEPASQLNVSSDRDNPERVIHCFYVEHCILSAYSLNSPSMNNRLKLKPRLALNLDSSHKQSSLAQGKYRDLHCPKHGPIPLASVAPDVIFNDVSDSMKVENEQIERCNLIGRGALGFVYKASLHSTFPLDQLGQGNQEVALKLLQPVDPGFEVDRADLAAYNSVQANWNREPFQSACKSYCSARHEINILQALCHPNIVQFIGLCVRPLAIVLELAPLGSLEEVFKNYKRAGSRIDQHSVQKTILQIARALEFLHQHRIIYRDLKTENVLVWNFPSPFATQSHSASVELKLADYGISRQALSTGIWKGFAGTINFLAPEILRHNGDEEYTEKVDCFSFGMLMYELLTLRPPFKQAAGREGGGAALLQGGFAPHEAVSRSLLDELATRPSLTTRDLIYPNYIFDLMSVCWSQEPQDRPTASQIVSIASTPEFMQVLDASPMTKGDNSGRRHDVSCAVYYEQCDQLDLWYFPNDLKASALETLSAQQGHWILRQMANATRDKSDYLDIGRDYCNALLDSKITASCLVGGQIWLFDSRQSLVHILPAGPLPPADRDNLSVSPDLMLSSNSESASLKIQSLQIDLSQLASNPHSQSIKSSQTLEVKQVIHAESVECLIMLTSDGYLLVCALQNNHGMSDMFKFRMLDNVSNVQFNCMAMLEHPSDAPVSPQQLVQSKFQLYCGQSDGISCFEMSSECQIVRQSILPLAMKILDTSGEQIVEASQTTEVSFILVSLDHMWTAAGCTVHLWSKQDKQVIRKLDCWKLVPCSESLESINIEQYYQESRTSSITSLIRVRGQLFVGTSHGCFIVIEDSTLKPIIVFRPYESEISILKPLICSPSATSSEVQHLVVIGRSYRDLMCRYVSSLDASTSNQAGAVSASRKQNDTCVAAILSAENHYNL